MGRPHTPRKTLCAKYRSDIDGLRAFAVTAVVLFHIQLPGLDWGFIGVDVFFVISAFFAMPSHDRHHLSKGFTAQFVEELGGPAPGPSTPG